MPTLEFEDGTTVDFAHFEAKDENLIKVNISDPDGGSEGIWACISDKDKLDYDANVQDEEIRIAICRNNTIAYMGTLIIGVYFPYKMNGQNRPTDMIQAHDGLRSIVYTPEAEKAYNKATNRYKV
jgi:hypothetical protein